MPKRTRILVYGGAIVVTIAGFGSAALGGIVAQAVAIALVSAGLGGALVFAFYEVGHAQRLSAPRPEHRDYRVS